MLPQRLSRCKLLARRGFAPHGARPSRTREISGTSTPLTLLRFLLFTAATILGPGVALQSLLGVRPDPALVIPIGAAFTAGFYWLGLVSGQAWILPIAVALAVLAAWLRRERPWAWALGPPLGGGLGPGLAIVAFLALTQYGSYR